MQEKMLLSVSVHQNNNTAASFPLTGDHVVGGDDDDGYSLLSPQEA